MIRPLAAAVLVAIAAVPASANDSTAELRTNGIIFVQTGDVAMAKEDLYISADEVRVDYVFRNDTDKDVKTLVAFPMPDITGNPFEPIAIPDDTQENFLDFTVAVDGKIVTPNLEMRASAVGLDVTDELKGHGLSLLPFGEKAYAAADALPEDVKTDMARRGILVLEQYDDGQGMKDHYSPYWTLKATYWWDMTFPARKEVRVQHRYKPGTGSSAGLNFWDDGHFNSPIAAEYTRRYCIDDDIKKAVTKATAAAKAEYPPFGEERIAYVLTTGQNWAGSIGQFHLTVDKGDPKNLVSFCGEGVTKTGPTTFELTAENFYPEKDLDILILQRTPDEAQ